MSQNSGSLYWSFSNDSFSFADSCRKKGFNWLKAPISCVSQQKKELPKKESRFW